MIRPQTPLQRMRPWRIIIIIIVIMIVGPVVRKQPPEDLTCVWSLPQTPPQSWRPRRRWGRAGRPPATSSSPTTSCLQPSMLTFVISFHQDFVRWPIKIRTNQKDMNPKPLTVQLYPLLLLSHRNSQWSSLCVFSSSPKHNCVSPGLSLLVFPHPHQNTAVFLPASVPLPPRLQLSSDWTRASRPPALSLQSVIRLFAKNWQELPRSNKILGKTHKLSAMNRIFHSKVSYDSAPKIRLAYLF